MQREWGSSADAEATVDGRYACRTKRGVTLLMTAAELVRRLLALVVPKGLHLTNYHGVFASHASARREGTVSRAPPPVSPESRPSDGSLRRTGDGGEAKQRRPRLDWATLHARTWGVDVWTCRCGGRRKVRAVVTSRRAAFRDAAPPRAVDGAAHSPPQLSLAV